MGAVEEVMEPGEGIALRLLIGVRVDTGEPDHRMPSEVARVTADEREVTPSFM